MYARKPRSPGWLILLLLLAATTLIGSAVGKYVRSFTLEEATVTFTAKLATSITLQEHEAVRQSDGSYQLSGETATKMSYTLIPGLDVPKDPHVTIKGKTPIDAYLFAEVVDKTPNGAITYAISEKWKKLDTSGKNGGEVYVYTNGGEAPVVVDEAVGQDFAVYLLENDKITVGQKLLSTTTNDVLQFYACMGETAFSEITGNTVAKAAEVYQKLNNPT